MAETCKYCGKEIHYERIRGGSFVNGNGLGYGEEYYEADSWSGRVNDHVYSTSCWTLKHGIKGHLPGELITNVSTGKVVINWLPIILTTAAILILIYLAS